MEDVAKEYGVRTPEGKRKRKDPALTEKYRDNRFSGEGENQRSTCWDKKQKSKEESQG